MYVPSAGALANLNQIANANYTAPSLVQPMAKEVMQNLKVIARSDKALASCLPSDK